jgi:hypothetical protein
MRAAFSSLVSLSLLIHAVLGCCWHHAHAGELLSSRASVADEPSDCCHHGAHPAEHPAPGPCNDSPHCEGICSYLPAPKSLIDMPQLVAPSDFAAILPAATDATLSAMLAGDRVIDLDGIKPPLRLHLLHQHLLI